MCPEAEKFSEGSDRPCFRDCSDRTFEVVMKVGRADSRDWLDTERKALLQGTPPDKLAPPATDAFSEFVLHHFSSPIA